MLVWTDTQPEQLEVHIWKKTQHLIAITAARQIQYSRRLLAVVLTFMHHVSKGHHEEVDASRPS